MALRLSIQGQTAFAGLPARATLVRWMRAALEHDAVLTLRFVSEREGRQLNREYRSKNYATDVLTFGYAQRPVIRADIVICVPAVKRAARAHRKSMHDHLAHLVVHAALHAQGYQHDVASAARAMEAREITVLRALRKADPYQ